MAEAETLEPTADRGTVRRNLVDLGQFQADFIQGQIAALAKTPAHPARQFIQLACPTQIALPLRQKPARLPTQFDHVIDEFRRNSEMTGRLSMTMAVVNKTDNAFS
jgi:hypothetical protein